MSSIKYDDVACDTVAQALEGVSLMLDDISTDLQNFVDACPDSSTISSKITKLATKTKENEDGILETYIDYDTRSYYQKKFGDPLSSAKTNVLQAKNNIGELKGNVTEIDERVKGIKKLIDEYEEKKPITVGNSSGLKLSAVSASGAGFSNPGSVGATDGAGKSDLFADEDSKGKPNLNIDTDGDGKADLNIDKNNDGKPDYNIDINGDGKADLNIDKNNDGKPDLNIDTNGDGKADLNIDTNNDGKPDLNIDTNGDGKADLNIDTNNDGKPDLNIDKDGDGKADLKVDEDGDGKVDPIKQKDTDPTDRDDIGGGGSMPKHDDYEKEEDKPPIFNKEEADKSTGGFNDNIASVGPGMSDTNKDKNDSDNKGAGIWAGPASGSILDKEDEAEAGLLPFKPGEDGMSSDGEEPDFIYRGLYDQSDDGESVGSMSYKSLKGEAAEGVAKGAAVAGAIGLGVSGMDAVATLNDQRKQEGDNSLSAEEKEEKKQIKTYISSGILGVLAIGFMVSAIIPNASVLGVILLGLAMAISAISASTGTNLGKYIGFGSVLASTLITFILSVAGVISPVGYIVSFGAFVVLSIAAYLLDLLKGMFDDKFELVPIIIAIAVGLLVGMFKVLDVINWIVFVLLLGLTVGGYFLWEKVIKHKLPDDDDADIKIDYSQIQAQPIQQPVVEEEKNFDPRDLYKDDGNNQHALADRMNEVDQNPFAGYNPMNSSFDNAFNDNSQNDNGDISGLFK